ncbi:MAG TPA: ATP synthase subunit I [Burkholderiales bacterium]|jgi:ATP synthase protein I|nr:ATP synthase subunit I [Burkholderiales bacterium]
MRYNFSDLPGVEGKSAMLPRLSKPIRKVLVWQVAVTAAIAVVAAFLAGAQGAVSAAVGGAISLIAGVASALVASSRAAKSAGGILVVALKAEAVKLGLALILLWLVLANYDDAVSGALLVSFVATMLVFSMALFVRDE